MESEPTVAKRIEIELPDELFDELVAVAQSIGIRDASEAAVVAIGDWVARRRVEIDDRDPSRKYFVNEALDELNKKHK
jgi:metal-responsive CopG/Arc/MetJ family transcriptional regulator